MHSILNLTCSDFQLMQSGSHTKLLNFKVATKQDVHKLSARNQCGYMVYIKLKSTAIVT